MGARQQTQTNRSSARFFMDTSATPVLLHRSGRGERRFLFVIGFLRLRLRLTGQTARMSMAMRTGMRANPGEFRPGVQRLKLFPRVQVWSILTRSLKTPKNLRRFSSVRMQLVVSVFLWISPALILIFIINQKWFRDGAPEWM